jgi:hypothetical protein
MEISIPAKKYLDFLTNTQPVIRILCQQLAINDMESKRITGIEEDDN